MEWYVTLLILISSLTLLLFMGLPVAFSLGLLSVVAAAFLWHGLSGIYGVVLSGYAHMSNFTLVCVPLFIFMAEIVMLSRMGTDTYEVANRFLRTLPGGLGITSVVFGTIFGAVCGASTAGTATVGLLSLPEMTNRGYKPEFAGAIVGFSGALSILIPPSVILIIYGTIADESIGKLFVGGFIPGIIMATLAILYILFKAKIHPSVAPKDKTKFSWREKLLSLWKVWGLLTVVIVLLGSIYTGVATPTEASAVGSFVVLVLALIKRSLNFKVLTDALLATVRTTAMIGWIIIGATSFGYIVIYSGCASQLTSWIISLHMPKLMIVFVLMIGYLIMGMFLDPVAIVMMTVPLILPLLHTLHINILWFGILITINMCAGNISPPMGLNLYIVKGLRPEIDLYGLFKAAVPFIIIDVITIMLVMFIPSFATWLPSLVITSG